MKKYRRPAAGLTPRLARMCAGIAIAVAVQAFGQDKLDLQRIALSPSAQRAKVAPTKHDAIAFALDKGIGALLRDDLTGYAYPESLPLALLSQEYGATLETAQARDCARYVISNVGRQMEDHYVRPTFHSEEKIRGEIAQAQGGLCATTPDAMQAAMAFLDDVNEAMNDKARAAAEKAEAERMAAVERARMAAEQARVQEEERLKKEADTKEYNRKLDEEYAARKKKHRDDIREGLVAIDSYQDAQIRYQAPENLIVMRPMAEPDGSLQALVGQLYSHEQGSNEWIGHLPTKGNPLYFIVITSNDTAWVHRDQIRINGGMFWAIGKYVRNETRTLVSGEAVTLPVIEALHAGGP